MLITWLKRRNSNNKFYYLELDGKKLDFKVQRIIGMNDHIYHLVKDDLMSKSSGYFKFRAEGFQSIGLAFPVDLIFVDWNGKVIKLMEDFKENKISERIKGTKFLYILPSKFIKKNNIDKNDVIRHYKKIEKGWYE